VFPNYNTTKPIQYTLSGVYLVGNILLSHSPTVVIDKICTRDSWYDSVLVHTLVSNIISLCFIIQISLILYQQGLNYKSHFLCTISALLPIVIFGANTFSVYGVVTGDYFGVLISNIIWKDSFGFIAFAILFWLCHLHFQLPDGIEYLEIAVLSVGIFADYHYTKRLLERASGFDQDITDILIAFMILFVLLSYFYQTFYIFNQNADNSKRTITKVLIISLIVGLAYGAYNSRIYIPYLHSKWYQNQLQNKTHMSLSNGLYDAYHNCTVDTSIDVWQHEILRLSLGYVLGPLCSMTMVWFF